MTVKNRTKLNYSSEFRIACKINNIAKEEIIQYLIDHVSFYSFIGGDMETAYLWATTVAVECKDFLNSPMQNESDLRIKEISLKYIKKLTNLSMSSKLKGQEESEKSLQLMKDWSVEMLPLTDYDTALITEDGYVFPLTFDFCLVCRVIGLDTGKLLQYFIDNISLARDRAMNVTDEQKINPSIAVLMVLVAKNEDRKNKLLPSQEIYRRYALRLLELDKKLKLCKEFENRLEIYSSFYTAWYNELNKNIN